MLAGSCRLSVPYREADWKLDLGSIEAWAWTMVIRGGDVHTCTVHTKHTEPKLMQGDECEE